MKKTKQQERVAFAHRFSELARQSGLSQRELAERIGISSGHVSKLMNGESYPNEETMTKICTAYGITEDAFRIPEDQMSLGDLQTPKLREKPLPYRLKDWKLIDPAEVFNKVAQEREVLLMADTGDGWDRVLAGELTLSALLRVLKADNLIVLEEVANETD